MEANESGIQNAGKAWPQIEERQQVMQYIVAIGGNPMKTAHVSITLQEAETENEAIYKVAASKDLIRNIR